VIYLDNAASSWPKPERVSQAMAAAVQDYAANPGRSGHALAVQAEQTIRKTRSAIARFIGVRDARNIIFYPNATLALNQALKGWRWQPGDEIISTSYEHNSVRRPLEYVRRQFGVRVHYVQPDHNGQVDLDELISLITERTCLLAATHVSNLTGAILPIEQIGEVASTYDVPFLVDASQSVGVLPVDVNKMHIDLLAFAGHKGLYGPQGTGVLYISPAVQLIPVVHGGTGSHSAEIDQPDVRPNRFEAGTPNAPGIAGLGAGLAFVQETEVSTIWEHEQALTKYALQKLSELPYISVYGPDADVKRAPVIAFNVHGIDPQEAAVILDQHYGIAVRSGLHCSPLAHQSVSTGENGAIRISFGYFNHKDHIDQLLTALEEIKIGLLGE
jgi:cysteine desulfurase family protein